MLGIHFWLGDVVSSFFSWTPDKGGREFKDRVGFQRARTEGRCSCPPWLIIKESENPFSSSRARQLGDNWGDFSRVGVARPSWSVLTSLSLWTVVNSWRKTHRLENTPPVDVLGGVNPKHTDSRNGRKVVQECRPPSVSASFTMGRAISVLAELLFPFRMLLPKASFWHLSIHSDYSDLFNLFDEYC